jgi:hypothetical protein
MCPKAAKVKKSDHRYQCDEKIIFAGRSKFIKDIKTLRLRSG